MNQGSRLRFQGPGIHLVKVVCAAKAGSPELRVLREGSTGQVVAMLPRVWAVAEAAAEPAAPVGVPSGSPAAQAPKVEVAFYRKYTEAMLRRYLKLSTDAGRTPSMLGQEMFRGNVTSYRAHSFEDVVVFCIDVEKCLDRLNAMDRELVKRIAMQHYTQGETASRLGISLNSCVLYYGRALDRLTTILLERRLLEPLKSCQ